MARPRLPVGNLDRIPDSDGEEEMDCREGKHPASEISESAFRRGFQQAVVAMLQLIQDEQFDASEVIRVADDIACEMRFDGRPHPLYMGEFQHRLRRRLSSGRRTPR